MMKKEDVLTYLTKIPKGMVTTYKDIAHFYHTKAYQAVGLFLHQNEDAILYPCYKVVKSDGTLASNYKFGGKEKQRELLEKEGIIFQNDKIDLTTYGFSLILETKRLYLRPFVLKDLPALESIMNDKVMFYYEKHFTKEDIYNWYLNQRNRYKTGYGLLACCLKETGEVIGQIGLTRQEIPQANVCELGYIFSDKHWHKHYVTEASKALIMLAYQRGIKDVYSIIKWNNYPSQYVALSNHMLKVGEFVKVYCGKEMPHYIYKVSKDGL